MILLGESVLECDSMNRERIEWYFFNQWGKRSYDNAKETAWNIIDGIINKRVTKVDFLHKGKLVASVAVAVENTVQWRLEDLGYIEYTPEPWTRPDFVWCKICSYYYWWGSKANSLVTDDTLETLWVCLMYVLTGVWKGGSIDIQYEYSNNEREGDIDSEVDVSDKRPNCIKSLFKIKSCLK